MQRFHQASELAQGAGEAIRCVGIDQALHHDMSRGQPVFQRRRQSHQLVPLLKDEFDADAATEQRPQDTIIGVPINAASPGRADPSVWACS